MSQQSDSFPRLADHRTPFIMNEWYVAALSSEVGRELMARTFLGRSVLLYRTMAGNVVAMRNRCPHRSFPLSKSRLEGDTVVCGYHGLHFGSDGKCIAVPSQDNVPEGLATASYPIVEKTPLVWIWMGDPTAADPATIPAHDYLSDPGFATVHGYMHSQSNYLRMHENVLDLTHFAYLHEGVGDLEYVQVPPKVEVKGNSVRITRTLADRPVLPAFGGFIGNLGHRVNRTSDSWFVSPAYHVSHSLIEDLEGGVNGKTMFHNKVVHCTTPETPHSCHYFSSTHAMSAWMTSRFPPASSKCSAIHSCRMRMRCMRWRSSGCTTTTPIIRSSAFWPIGPGCICAPSSRAGRLPNMPTETIGRPPPSHRPRNRRARIPINAAMKAAAPDPATGSAQDNL